MQFKLSDKVQFDGQAKVQMTLQRLLDSYVFLRQTAPQLTSDGQWNTMSSRLADLHLRPLQAKFFTDSE